MKKIIFLLMATAIIAGCSNYTPKPYAYFRIDMPKPAYEKYDSTYIPCTFEKSKYAVASPIEVNAGEQGLNIEYTHYNAKIHCTYVTINNNFRQLSEDDHALVNKHNTRAEAITEQPFEYPEGKVYGIMYEIEGNAASPLQFVLTDSVKHFIRGSLYFTAQPNADSIAPVANFIKNDVKKLIETFKWE